MTLFKISTLILFYFVARMAFTDSDRSVTNTYEDSVSESVRLASAP